MGVGKLAYYCVLTHRAASAATLAALQLLTSSLYRLVRVTTLSQLGCSRRDTRRVVIRFLIHDNTYENRFPVTGVYSARFCFKQRTFERDMNPSRPQYLMRTLGNNISHNQVMSNPQNIHVVSISGNSLLFAVKYFMTISVIFSCGVRPRLTAVSQQSEPCLTFVTLHERFLTIIANHYQLCCATMIQIFLFNIMIY